MHLFNSIALLIAISFITTSCKTSEELRREKLVDDMAIKMMQSEKSLNQSQQLTGDLTVHLRRIEEENSQLSGMIEELTHQNKLRNEALDEQLNIINDKLSNLEKTQKSQAAEQDSLSEQVASEKKYLQKVLKALKNVQKKSASSSSSGQLKEYNAAIKLFNKGQYTKIKDKLEYLLGENKLGAAKKNKMLHALGVIAYKEKDYQKVIIYMSKIYSKYPRSSVAPNALYHIGLALIQKQQIAEGKEALKELIKKYPKFKNIKEAEEMLKGLK